MQPTLNRVIPYLIGKQSKFNYKFNATYKAFSINSFSASLRLQRKGFNPLFVSVLSAKNVLAFIYLLLFVYIKGNAYLALQPYSFEYVVNIK